MWNSPAISTIVLIALIVVIYVGASLGVARWAASTGRKTLKWFFLSLLTAGLAAMVAYRRDLKAGLIQHNELSEPLPPWQEPQDQQEPQEQHQPQQDDSLRCPQCGQKVRGDEERANGMIRCSRCGYEFQEKYLA